jgi:accessory colonization factor AcfC
MLGQRWALHLRDQGPENVLVPNEGLGRSPTSTQGWWNDSEEGKTDETLRKLRSSTTSYHKPQVLQ